MAFTSSRQVCLRKELVMGEKRDKKLTINDMAISMATIEERVKVLPSMDKHLGRLNGSISETNVKLASTTEIAKAADKKSDNNRRYLDKLTIALIAAIVTGMASAAMWAVQLTNGS